MRLMIVKLNNGVETLTDTGLEFGTQSDLEKDMRKNYTFYKPGEFYTLHQDRPVCANHEEKQTKLNIYPARYPQDEPETVPAKATAKKGATE